MITLPIDHVVVAVGYDLDAAMQDYRALGFTVTYGGVHASGATHNALIWFADSTFIELLALTGNDPKTGALDFSPMVSEKSGLVGYALRSFDLIADVERLRANSIPVNEPVESGRLRPDGVRLAWRNALISGSYAPFLIEYVSPPDDQRVPSDRLLTTHRSGASRLCGVDFAQGIVTLAAPSPLIMDEVKSHGVTYQAVEACP